MHHWFAKLEPFSVAVRKGIKNDYWWWPLIDLTCKYMLALNIVYTERQKVISSCTLLLILITYTNFSGITGSGTGEHTITAVSTVIHSSIQKQDGKLL